MDYLQSLQSEGYELSEIEVNYRYDEDSDVKKVTFVGEDLYDEKDNQTLKSIILTTR
jgi:hypothetical protein